MSSNPLEKRLNEFIERVRKNAEKAQNEAVAELSEEARQKAAVEISPEAERLVQELFDQSVANWYNAWRGSYRRTNSLYSILQFDDTNDGVVAWGYHDEGLWHPSIFDARDAQNHSTGMPYAYYNIYNMAFERGSHGNKLPGYMPVVTESPLSMIRKGKPKVSEQLSKIATEVVQEYFNDNYIDRFNQKFTL